MMDMIFKDDDRPWLHKGAALGVFAGMTAGAAWLGSMAMSRSSDRWYDGLDKPWFTPPKAVFGPVWAGLYALIALSGYRVWRTPRSRRRRTALGLWATQLVLNAAWTPLFFGLRRPGWAFVEIVILWLAIVATTVSFWRVSRPAGLMLVPYSVWTLFAAVLNGTIWWMNR